MAAINLNVGDRLKARPCEVTVVKVEGSLGWGECETCDGRHLLDRRLFEDGKGPWLRVGSGREVQP